MTDTPKPVCIKFFASAGDIAAAPVHESEIEEFDAMPSEDELSEMAREHMFESVRPEFWWEIVDAAGVQS
jgi:hypothetical protein